MKNTKELLGREMSRAEFIRFGVMAILALFGAKNLISFLQSQQHQYTQTPRVAQQTSHGFGSSKFGV